MVTFRFIQSEIIRVAKAELTFAYGGRGDDGTILFALSPRGPIVVGERVTGASGLYAGIVRGGFLAFFQVGESNRR